jgi:NADPH:quinone reductase-like Zn-dependent oxidoreductase
MAFPRVVPHSDGAGTIDAIGEGVIGWSVGERVWVYNAQWRRPSGTAAEQVVLPAAQAVPLSAGTSFVEGACLGIPAMTAHRCLFADGPLRGRSVLVTGGAGAVGFYAIALAKWAGATVLTTVSSPQKAAQAREAGADHVIDYKREKVADRVREATGGAGVDRIVEVDLGANLAESLAALAPHGVIAVYASMGEPEPKFPVYPLMIKNATARFVLVYEMPEAAKAAAREDITRFLESGKARHAIAARFPLAETAAAHREVESGAKMGQVVVEIA